MEVERKPWQCMKCNIVHAPHVDNCKCQLAPLNQLTWPYIYPIYPCPVYPYPWGTTITLSRSQFVSGLSTTSGQIYNQ